MRRAREKGHGAVFWRAGRHAVWAALLLGACTGTAYVSGPDAAGPDALVGADGAPADAAGPDAAGPDAQTPDAQTPDAQTPDAAADPPLSFNIGFRQTVQDCSSCGIWFDWQGVQSQKPRLVVEYTHLGQSHTVEYQHGLGGMDNAHSVYFAPDGDWAKHSLLVKQSPARNGLFRADLSAIPASATIISATLHLHLETDEGLSYNDFTSVLSVYACDTPWNWDHVTWSQYDSGLSWGQAGGDYGALVREIRAKEDLRDRGFSKANPNAHFDFTDHVQQLQAAR